MKSEGKSEYLKMAELCLWLICLNLILSQIPRETLKAPAPIWARIIIVATVGIVTFICTYNHMSKGKK
jgi:hypothetical protein